MNNIYNYAKHCFKDKDFNMGGNPQKEKYYLNKMGLTPEDKDVSMFYQAMCTLYELNKKYQ